MAIKRAFSNPVVILDCVVAGVERDVKRIYENDKPTGEVVDNGRKLTLQTGLPNSDQLELKVPVGSDDLQFQEGQHLLINAEYMEWRLENGTRGSTLRFHSFVTENQLDSWSGVVKSAAVATAL